MSPRRLVSTFPAPDEHVHTLYDNWETSVARFPHVPCLGSRRRDAQGELGPYTWLTYSQAGDIRTAIGSGLLQLGVQPKAMVGLYSVNSKGGCAVVGGAVGGWGVSGGGRVGVGPCVGVGCGGATLSEGAVSSSFATLLSIYHCPQNDPPLNTQYTCTLTRTRARRHARTEWVLLDAAAHAYSMTTVPLYDTLGPDAVE